MIKVLVSREFEVDSATNVDEVFKSFRDRGWSVTAQAPACPQAQTPAPAPAEFEPPSIEEVAATVEGIMARHRLSRSGVGDLIGLTDAAIYHWLRGTSKPCEESWRRLQKLYRRSARTPKSHSQRLRDEARGAGRQRRSSPVRPSAKLNDDQRIEIAERRQRGEATSALAAEFGVSDQTIRDVYRQVAG